MKVVSSGSAPTVWVSSIGLIMALTIPDPSNAAAREGATATTPDPRAQQVEAVLAPWDLPDAPGLALAVLDEGEVVYRRALGSANLEQGVPITARTVFQAASLSKQFTGVAVALLADRGRLSLDDDVRRYLPEVPDFGTPITLRQLLHHTSGLRDLWELLLLAGWSYEDLVTQEHVWSLVERQRTLNFPPGSEYLYTNTGYTLLAEVVERVTGRTFRDWMRDEIFTPLSMTSSQILDDERHLIPGRAEAYYGGDDGAFEKAIANVSTYGATNLYTTVDDLLKWVRGLERATLADRAVLEEAQTAGRLADGSPTTYAFGWRTAEDRGLRVLSHGGGQGGYRSYLIHYPERRVAVAVLANLGTVPAASIARQVADVYLGELPARDEGDAHEHDAPEPEAETYVASLGELDGLVGFYRCEELGATYEVVVHEGGLALNDPRKGLMPLIAVSQDRFEEDMSDEFGITHPWMRTFEFERTESGEGSGFVLSVGSARNLRFVRLSSTLPAGS